MNSLVTGCTFCGRRHTVSIEDLDIFFAQCECGAYGFVQEEAELVDRGYKTVGFTVHEVPNMLGTFVHLSDPIPIFVNDRSCWVYICWYKKDDRAYV